VRKGVIHPAERHRAKGSDALLAVGHDWIGCGNRSRWARPAGLATARARTRAAGRWPQRSARPGSRP
jgi:hypothetical protein